MIVLGIDPGTHHTGIAVWDDPDLPARPVTTIDAKGAAIVPAIAKLAREYEATELVVGLALQLDGRESQSSRSARALAATLAKVTGLPVALQDERLTTSQAHRNRMAAGVKGRAGIDAHAAVIVLQTFVDARRHAWRRPADDES